MAPMPPPGMGSFAGAKYTGVLGMTSAGGTWSGSSTQALPPRPRRDSSSASLSSMTSRYDSAGDNGSDSLGESPLRSRAATRATPLAGKSAARLSKRKKTRRPVIDAEGAPVARSRYGKHHDVDLEAGRNWEGDYTAGKLKDKYRKRRNKKGGCCSKLFCCVCGCIPCVRPRVLFLLGICYLGAKVMKVDVPTMPLPPALQEPLDQLQAADMGGFLQPLLEKISDAVGDGDKEPGPGMQGPHALFDPDEEQDEGFFGWLQSIGMELPIGLSVAERDRLRAEYAELYDQLQAAKTETEEAKHAAEEERLRAMRAEKAQEEGDGFAKSLDNELNAVNLKLMAAKRQLDEARRRADEDMQESLSKEQRLQTAIGQYEAVMKKLQNIQEPVDAGAAPQSGVSGPAEAGMAQSQSQAPPAPRGRQIVAGVGELHFSDNLAGEVTAKGPGAAASVFHIVPAAALNSAEHTEELTDEDEVTWVLEMGGTVLLTSAHHYQFVESAVSAAKRALFAMEEGSSLSVVPGDANAVCQVRLSSKTGLLLGLSPAQSHMQGCEEAKTAIITAGMSATVAPPHLAQMSEADVAAEAAAEAGAAAGAAVAAAGAAGPEAGAGAAGVEPLANAGAAASNVAAAQGALEVPSASGPANPLLSAMARAEAQVAEARAEAAQVGASVSPAASGVLPAAAA